MTDTSTATSSPAPRRLLGLLAAIMLNMVFGSLYAWSVFIAGLEHDLGVMRTDVSIVFSLAIVCFTLGNFLIPFAFGRMPTPALPLFGLISGAGGLALAAMGDGYLAIVIGYGLLFGLGCGLNYNVVLQSGLMALPGKPGLANGLIISSFAAGGVCAAYLLEMSVAAHGVKPTFWALALTIAATGVCALVLIAASGIRLPRQNMRRPDGHDSRTMRICWIGFFLGAVSGVMSIGHAAPIIMHFGGAAEAAVLGVTLLSIGNAAGRLASGWLSDYVAVRSVAGISHLTGTLGFIAVLANPSGEGAVIAMALAGVAYGMTAGIYPSAISILLGHKSYGRNFAVLLTAWGVAGLFGPVAGGYFFDVTGDYRVSLEIACAAAVLALFNAMQLPKVRRSQS
jgi:OFA family oxalate/formate antiporter-like MFS transporter